MKLKNVAIVIGHEKYRTGAYSPFLKSSEYAYNKEVAKLIGCDTFMHPQHISYRSKMRSTYRSLTHYDLTLELHFNASSRDGRGSGAVQGAEALYFHTNAEGRAAAQIFSSMVSKEYQIRNRGAKPLSNANQRGYWAVASGIPTGLILEPFFGDHPDAIK
ncbi:MAG: hypothetical protein ACPGTP_09645, partial [Bacteroidia bacterium]